MFFSVKKPFGADWLREQVLVLVGAVVTALAVAAFAAQLMSEIRSEIAGSRQELVGLDYVVRVRRVIEPLQEHRGLVRAYQSGGQELRADVLRARSATDDAMNQLVGRDASNDVVIETFARLEAAGLWWSLVRDAALDLPPGEAFERHSVLIRELMALMTSVAYSSGASRDSSGGSHNVKDSIIKDLPMLLEAMAQFRGMGVGALHSSKVEPEEAVRIRAIQILFNDATDHVSKQWRQLGEANAAVAHALGPAMEKLVAETDMVRRFFDAPLHGARAQVAPKAFFDKMTEAMGAGFALLDASVQQLQAHLHGRIVELERRLYLVGAIATFVLMLVAALFISLVRTNLERENAHRQLQLAAKMIQHSREAIFVTDKDQRIIAVNQAFTDITGYAPEDVLGQNPRMWKSGRQLPEFYKEMHEALDREGYWQGEVWNRRKNGEIYPEWVSISTIRNDKGKVTNYLRLSMDISDRKRNEERLEYLANYDVLTGMPNRSLFNQRLKSALAHAQRYGNMAAVVFIDLDRFKNINDTLGHDTGDLLLKEAAARLKGCLRESDTVARLGGDEFVALLPEVAHTHDVRGVAQKLLDALVQPFLLSGNEYQITASIGISCYPEDGADASALLKHADVAMYRAKEQGKNNIQFYSAHLNQDSRERLELEMSLRRALERDEFRLLYQPKINVRTHKVTGVEALIRWQHPELGQVSPAKFIPLAEETGLIAPIGDWVLRAACSQMSEWRRQGLPPLRVAVNLSARQFGHQDLLQNVERLLEETGLQPDLLELEITESAVMQNPEHAAQALGQLRSLGVHLSIDDFGTGYSSLAYLKKFPFNTVKIDRSFIQDLPGDADSAALTRAIIAIADSLKLTVVAEGVEGREQLDFLREHACHEVQGYHISRPLAADQCFAFLRDREQPHGRKPSALKLVVASGEPA